MNKKIQNGIKKLSHRIFKNNGVQFSEVEKAAYLYRREDNRNLIIEGCQHSTDVLDEHKEYRIKSFGFNQVLAFFLLSGYEVIGSRNLNSGNYLNEELREELI